MPRQKLHRKVISPPGYKGFQPIGLPEVNNPVVINYEEYEAIRLCDFNLLGQVAAANLMEISRPTFTRIYESARRKVANAFVSGRPIIFEGGKVFFDSDWFKCNSCNCWFSNPAKSEKVDSCALCGSTTIVPCNDENKPL
jgi:predicted DNA-binding protein (UPF0251 family)